MKFTPEQTEILLKARSGELNDSGNIMFYDLTFNRFIRVNPNGKLYYYNEKAAIRKAYKLVNYSVKGKYVVEELPDYICKFNPKEAGGFYEKDGEQFFNFFEEPEAFALKRVKEHKSLDISFVKKYQYFNILLKNLFVKEEYLEYFINWLSTIINERIKTRTAIILKGIEGTGKGVLEEELITPIFSEQYTVTLENEALRSQYNGDLENKLFVFFNEIKGDFRESATLYEKLKIYISDHSVNINNKYGWAGTAENHFNCMFFSNNSLPVQISTSDRRYTVFNTSNTPLLEICERIGITTDDFIEGLRKERDSFIRDLFAYNYNSSRASKTMDTEEKTIISEATTPKIQLVSNKLKEQNFEWLFSKGTEILETMKIDINNAVLENTITTIEEKLPTILEDHLTKGFVTNEDLVILYRLFVNLEETSSIKISNAWTPYLGKATPKKLSGKTVRVRVIGEKKEWKRDIKEDTTNKEVEMTDKEVSAVMDEVIKDIQSSKAKDTESIYTEEFEAFLNEPVKEESKESYERRQRELAIILSQTTPLDDEPFQERKELTKQVQEAQKKISDPLSEITEEEFDAIVEAAYGSSNETFGDLLAAQSA